MMEIEACERPPVTKNPCSRSKKARRTSTCTELSPLGVEDTVFSPAIGQELPVGENHNIVQVIRGALFGTDDDWGKQRTEHSFTSFFELAARIDVNSVVLGKLSCCRTSRCAASLSPHDLPFVCASKSHRIDRRAVVEQAEEKAAGFHGVYHSYGELHDDVLRRPRIRRDKVARTVGLPTKR